MGIKLNLGCGENLKLGYLNVDKYGTPDLQVDLERFPWPWADNSVSEILMNHVLEHLGETSEIFIGLMKELYRVCEDDAMIRIVVPHPRHDHFIGDPTHVRQITMEMMALFSKKQNRAWIEAGGANSPLALFHDINFEIIEGHYTFDEPYLSDFKAGRLTTEDLALALRKYNNVAKEICFTLNVIKG